MNISITAATKHSVAPYGKLIEPPVGEVTTFSAHHFQYWKQQGLINVDGAVEIGVLQVKRNTLPFNQLERHDFTPELLIPLNGDFAIPLAVNTGKVPELDAIEVLQVSQGQALLLKPGCWHWMPFPLVENITILIIFKDNTSSEDLIIENLAGDCTISG